MAPAGHLNYQRDERVFCFHHEILYEAKIIDLRHIDPDDRKSPFEYLVHYKGWKNTYVFFFPPFPWFCCPSGLPCRTPGYFVNKDVLYSTSSTPDLLGSNVLSVKNFSDAFHVMALGLRGSGWRGRVFLGGEDG